MCTFVNSHKHGPVSSKTLLSLRGVESCLEIGSPKKKDPNTPVSNNYLRKEDNDKLIQKRKDEDNVTTNGKKKTK
jgi:hypothetical protein